MTPRYPGCTMGLMPKRILIVDDELKMCHSLGELLNERGFVTAQCTDASKVPRMLEGDRFDLMVLDIRMPGVSGIDVLRNLRASDPRLPVIMVTGFPSIEVAVEAMKYGASNLFVKPLEIGKLVREIEMLTGQGAIVPAAGDADARILTRNPEMQRILKSIDKVAATDAPVLITGESGSGKELVAEALQRNGRRRDAPFVKVNCAALAESLLESELFGHEKGAFTGAIAQHKGKFELARGGTLFLDEIGDMALATQAKILRVLQDRELLRLGGENPVRTDVRLITATNKDLDKLIERGDFREDLYYRISVVTLSLPPLRDRREDVSLLVEHFVRTFNRQYGKSITSVSREAMELLHSHHWPGNIRELRNCVERAVIFSESDELLAQDLPRQYLEVEPRSPRSAYNRAQEELDRKIILEALKKNEGIKQKAADSLQMHRKTLYNKMKKLGLT